MENHWHVIGEGDNPIYICRKGDVPELFNQEFYYCYEIWKYFNAGFGLPYGKSWTEQDPDIMETILTMETHFRSHFSLSIATIKYIEAIIRRMDARAKAGL